MLICKALLKYGYSNFSLEILEYCDPSECISREDYYLKLLDPKYNILQEAGSSIGLKHTEEAKAKISAAKLGCIHSEETKLKLSQANKGENNPCFGRIGENHPMFGKPKPEGSGRPSQHISVFDKETNETTCYDSISAAATALNFGHSSIRYCLKSQNPYKGRYVFKLL